MEQHDELEHPGIFRACQCTQCRAKRQFTSTKNRRFWKRLLNKKRRKSSAGEGDTHYWA